MTTEKEKLKTAEAALEAAGKAALNAVNTALEAYNKNNN